MRIRDRRKDGRGGRPLTLKELREAAEERRNGRRGCVRLYRGSSKFFKFKKVGFGSRVNEEHFLAQLGDVGRKLRGKGVAIRRWL